MSGDSESVQSVLFIARECYVSALAYGRLSAKA
jgi:hypothetical protein